MVPEGRSDSAHGTVFHGTVEGKLPRAPHLLER